MAKNKKLKTIISTQAFSPIKDIQRGIIITKDGRYVKLMEFSPINFGLKSESDQETIISQFTAAVRAMPRRVHFKVLSTRADSTRFLRAIDQEMESERYVTCRNLQAGLKDYIYRMSSAQGVARRFFIDFEFEESEGFKLKHRPSFNDIYFELNRTSALIRTALERCGNRQVSIDDSDEYTYSALHAIMSRAESSVYPFAEHRQWDVMARYGMNQSIDFSQSVYIPPNDFFCPERIDNRSSPRYIEIDGLYYMFCYIPAGAYPSKALAGWPVIFINMGAGIDFDFWYSKENIQRVQLKLQQALRFKKLKVRESDDSDQGYDELLSSIQAAYYFKQGISGNEDFCYMASLITITADTVEELEFRWQQVKVHCVRNNMALRQCWLQQKEAFRSSLPICNPDPGIWAKSKRNVLTRDLGAAYPFVSYELCDDGGILLGQNHENGSLVFVNLFDQNKYINANGFVIGSSGAGKTYLLLLMALRMREKHIQTFQIASLKSKESERVCEAVGGSFVKLAAGSKQTINILEIRPKDAEEEKYLTSQDTELSMLLQKVQKLHVFFSLAIKELTYAEDQILDRALIETYAKFSITEDNDSIIDPKRPGVFRKMPILSDLYVTLEEMGDETKRLRESLRIFLEGSLKNFNAQTNVNLENEYIVMDISDIAKDYLPMAMFVALDYIWDKTKENRTRLKSIYIDEVWSLIGKGASPLAAQYVFEMVKTIRGCGGSVILSTQDISDFFGLEDGSYGAGILNSCKFKFIMKTEPVEADRIAEYIDLSRKEWADVKTFDRGTALLLADNNHVVLDVKSTPQEHQLITTKREDLLKIARQRELEESHKYS